MRVGNTSFVSKKTATVSKSHTPHKTFRNLLLSSSGVRNVVCIQCKQCFTKTEKFLSLTSDVLHVASFSTNSMVYAC